MRIRFSVLLSALTVLLLAQPPGTWQDHVSLNSCNSVTRMGNTVYASYVNGIMYFEENEIAPQRLNKINGLSDVGIRLLRTNDYNNKLLIIYENANIDILDPSGAISNYPDLRLKTMNARKTVNEVTFDRQFAYLACGFGIVVFDTEKLEIRETYYIGPQATNVEVFQVALSPTHIFAATKDGLFQAQRNTSLVNFNNWQLNPGLPAGAYNGVVNVDGEIIANKSMFAEKGENFQDTLYQFTPGGWQVYPHVSGQGKTILKFGYTRGPHFSVLQSISMQVINVHTGAPHILIQGYNGQIDYGTLRDNYFSNKDEWFTYWIADRRFGLFKATTLWDPQQRVSTNGMNNRNVSNIDIVKGKVAVSPSHIFKEGQGTYTSEGINLYLNGQWSYVPVEGPDGGLLQDINSVLIDRIDTSVMWATAWRYGVLKFKDNKLVRTYTPENTPALDSIVSGEILPGALAQDAQGNVFFSLLQSVSPMCMINRAGNLVTYVPQGGGAQGAFTRRMMFDRNGYLWMPHERDAGITVTSFDAQNRIERSTKLSQQVGQGNLGSNAVYCVTEDHDGRIWIGTSAGIRVLYNSSDVFEEGEDFDAQPIKIEQDGNVELLLGAETVTDIHVDGANNKWVGTASGGIYCFSPDGMRQLFHFTAENSPLYSNSVLDLNYDERTGDLFIATEQGLQTYRGVVIAGFEDYSTLHAYPNPVRPGYIGPVLLRGLMDDSLVKITDVAGNLVWETRASGGQVQWPLTTLTGERVTAGVYIVYTTTSAAEHKAVTKVLVMN